MTAGTTTRIAGRLPAPAKRIAHAGAGLVGRASAGRRVLPSFLIVGGQRCGTTSMYRALSAHPAVLKPVWHKGVHYFDVGFRHGPRWYRSHFPLRRTAERAAAAAGCPAQAFESSPYYLYHPLAAERIAATLPGVKLVVLIRDPVERACSQHAHELARGFETEPDLAAALRAEPERLRGAAERLAADPDHFSHAHRHHGYTDRGRYVEHLDRLAAAVGRDSIHVVDADRFFTDPGPAYDGVLDFLGLPRRPHPRFDRHNARRRAPIDPGLRAALSRHFAPHNERLADWLGFRPSFMDA